MEGLKSHLLWGCLLIYLVAVLTAFDKNKPKSHFIEKHLSVLSL
jgi:hypothetical protein